MPSSTSSRPRATADGVKSDDHALPTTWFAGTCGADAVHVGGPSRCAFPDEDLSDLIREPPVRPAGHSRKCLKNPLSLQGPQQIGRALLRHLQTVHDLCRRHVWIFEYGIDHFVSAAPLTLQPPSVLLAEVISRSARDRASTAWRETAVRKNTSQPSMSPSSRTA